MRTLIHDLGQALGCGAVMTSLRRTKACGFSLDDCLTLEEARALSEKGTLCDRLLPVDLGLSGYQAVRVTDAQFTRFRNGGALFLSRWTRLRKPTARSCGCIIHRDSSPAWGWWMKRPRN